MWIFLWMCMLEVRGCTHTHTHTHTMGALWWVCFGREGVFDMCESWSFPLFSCLVPYCSSPAFTKHIVTGSDSFSWALNWRNTSNSQRRLKVSSMLIAEPLRCLLNSLSKPWKGQKSESGGDAILLGATANSQVRVHIIELQPANPHVRLIEALLFLVRVILCDSVSSDVMYNKTKCAFMQL